MSYLYAGSENGAGLPTPATASLSIPIDEASRVGEVRRAAGALAASLGLSQSQQSDFAIVVTEAANNLLRHAGGGEILLRGLAADGTVGVELLALDKGPGMSNLAQCLQDGYSTGGTSGAGLGAIKRLSTSLDIYTVPGAGTVLRATAWTKPNVRADRLDIGLVNRPTPKEEMCGDSWAALVQGERSVFFVVDGLGHGPDAAKAAGEAVRVFERFPDDEPGRLLERMSNALSGTRGAAAAVAAVDETTHVLTFAGVGNIAGAVFQGERSSSMVSHHGIVGYRVHKIQEFTYGCPPGSVVILSSDGIATLRNIETYPGLMGHSAALIAGVLYRDFQRTNDDATILVIKMA